MQEIGTNTWRPNESEFIVGSVDDKKSGIGVNKSMMYTLKTERDGIVALWGSKVLDEKMAHVNIGDLVRITYLGLGEAKRGMNPPKLWKVEVDR